MSEMSREEAIRELDVMGGNCSTDYDYKVCHQAISDMEKLKNIEKVYKEYNILCSECPADRERGECNDCFVYNIEKVLRGEL